MIVSVDDGVCLCAYVCACVCVCVCLCVSGLLLSGLIFAVNCTSTSVCACVVPWQTACPSWARSSDTTESEATHRGLTAASTAAALSASLVRPPPPPPAVLARGLSTNASDVWAQEFAALELESVQHGPSVTAFASDGLGHVEVRGTLDCGPAMKSQSPFVCMLLKGFVCGPTLADDSRILHIWLAADGWGGCCPRPCTILCTAATHPSFPRWLCHHRRKHGTLDRGCGDYCLTSCLPCGPALNPCNCWRPKKCARMNLYPPPPPSPRSIAHCMRLLPGGTSVHVMPRCPPPPPIVQATPCSAKVALILGNDAYDKGFDLAHALSSASAVADRLTGLGYSVMHRYNAGLATMQAAFESFRRELSNGCSAAIYFCGHGWQDAGSADCLLVPVDFDGASPTGTNSTRCFCSPVDRRQLHHRCLCRSDTALQKCAYQQASGCRPSWRGDRYHQSCASSWTQETPGRLMP